MNRIILAAAAVGLFAACSQEDAVQGLQSAGKSYNASYRDKVIANWQARVRDDEPCKHFKQRFYQTGIRHESAASGKFVNDMQTVLNDVKASGCEYKP